MVEAGSPTAFTSCPAGSEESEMENGLGAQEVPVTQGWESNSVRATVVIEKVKLEPDKTKEWFETAVRCSVTTFSCSQGGFHFIYLAGDGGRF